MQENMSVWVCVLIKFNPVCSAIETSYTIANLFVGNLDVILFGKWLTKALIRLHRYTGWTVPLLFECSKIRFSLDEAHIRSSGKLLRQR